jgi:toxin secretion/phage lysis holin
MNKVLSLLLILGMDWILKLVEYFEKYIFQDWGFAKYLIVPIILDTILGARRAVKQKKFTWKRFDKILDKLVSYISILILVHVMTSFTVDDKTINVFNWMRVAVFSGLIAKEGYSIIKNIAAVDRGYVPSWLIKKLEDFDKTGKFFEKDDEPETKNNKIDQDV